MVWASTSSLTVHFCCERSFFHFLRLPEFIRPSLCHKRIKCTQVPTLLNLFEIDTFICTTRFFFCAGKQFSVLLGFPFRRFRHFLKVRLFFWLLLPHRKFPLLLLREKRWIHCEGRTKRSFLFEGNDVSFMFFLFVSKPI